MRECQTTGKQFCFAHGAGYCKRECPQAASFAHGCEFCGHWNHRTVGCSSKPSGFVHPWLLTVAGRAAVNGGNAKGGGGKGGGKKDRKGRGKGKKSADY